MGILSAICLRAYKVLLVRECNVWRLPGGEPREAETDEACLLRVIAEELAGIYKVEIKASLESRTSLNGDKAYFVEFYGDPRPNGAVGAVMWTQKPTHFNISKSTYLIISELKSGGYLA